MPIDVLEVSDDEDNRFTFGKLTDKLLHTGKVCPEFFSTLIDGFGFPFTAEQVASQLG